MKTLAFIWTLFKKFPGRFISNILLLTCVGLMEMAGVFSIAPVIDVFLHPDLSDISSVTQKFISWMSLLGISPAKINFIIILLVFNISLSVFTIFARYSIFQTKYDVLKDLTIDMYNSFFYARWSFFSGSNQGTMLNTFNREMVAVGESFGEIGYMFSNIFRLAFYLVVPFCISWQVTIIGAGFGLIFAIPLLFFGPLNYKLGQKCTSTANKYMGVIQESFGAAKIILGYGNQRKNMTDLESAFEDHRKVAVRVQTLWIATPKIFEPFGWAAIFFTIYLSIEYFAVPFADVAIIAYTLLRIVPIIGTIFTQKNSLLNFLPSYEQIKNMNTMARQEVQKTGNLPFRQLVDAIELKGVCFAYPNNNLSVLKDIDVIIRKGEITAFVGGSGAGKSTLIDMLIGFYEPDKGVITVDGNLLFDYDIWSYRQHIGFVPQDSVLFNTTIRNNLLWSKDGLTENDITEACMLANAHDFIMEMPDNYDTVIGDRGIRLSGGQRQRIALARAILRKPELLILDEATSALDSHSEKLIQNSIEKISNSTTIVVIAHRLSTIKDADMIYHLEDGSIIESGTFDQLMNIKGGKFFRSAQLQGIGQAVEV